MKVELGDICNFQSGGTPSRKRKDYFNGNIPWITTVALNGKTVNEKDAVAMISDSAIRESAAKIVPQKSIMIGTRVGVGKVAMNMVPMATNQDIISAIGIDEQRWDKDYIVKLIISKQNLLKSEARGATIKGIKVDTLKKIEIPNIPIEKQRAIAFIFNRLDKVIEQQEKQKDLLDQLVKSRFIEMFGDVICNNKAWEIRTFSEIASSRLGKMLDTKQQTGKNRYPYLANFNVQWFRFDLDNLNQMDFDESDRIEFELRDGDLLVCEGGEIGRCAVWHNEIQPCFFQKALHRVRCDRHAINPDYLAWWFKYNCDNGGFASIVGAKATIAHLPGVKLKQLQVVVPPIELQNQFADFVEQVDKSKLAIQKSLEQLETLKKSLMQEYFA